MAKTAASDTYLSARHLITTEAKPERCRDCRQWVLRGYSSGIPTVVDMAPADEAFALAAGLCTYELWGGRLSIRDDWSGCGRRGVPSGPILADHKH